MLDYHYHLPFSMNRLSDIPSPSRNGLFAFVGCGMNLLQVHISLLSDDYVQDPFEVVKIGDEAPEA